MVRVALLLLALAAPVAAQTPSERQTILALRDSLAVIRDPQAVRRLEDDGVALARRANGDVPLDLHLRLGLIALRLGELKVSHDDYETAKLEFGDVTRMRPQWAWSHLGLGMAELGVAGTRLRFGDHLRKMLGNDPLRGAREAFRQALTLDITTAEEIARASEQALYRGTDQRLEAALGILRELAPLDATTVPLLLARARLERRAGDPDSAWLAADRALRLAPRDPAALLEAAHTRFVIGRGDAAPTWYRGLLLADAPTLAQYRSDLVLVLPDSTLRVLDQGDGSARVAAVRRFWDSQNLDGLPTTGERLRDHYHRLDMARRSYLLPAIRVVGGDAPKRTLPSDEFDERGVVMVRHGVPTQTAHLNLMGVPPNESWVYRRVDGSESVFHFLDDDDDGIFLSVESVVDMLAASGQGRWAKVAERLRAGGDSVVIQTYGAELSAQTMQELMLTRVPLSDMYRRMYDEGKGGAERNQREERRAGRAALAEGPTWSLTHELVLPAAIDVLGVGGDARGQRVEIAVAIPGHALTPQRTTTNRFAYPVRMRVAAVSASGEVVAAIDTMRTFATAAPIDAGGHLLARLPLTLPPGTYQVRVAIETSEVKGIVTPRRHVTVVDPRSTTPTLSDMVLGVRSVRLAMPVRGADSAWANPLHRFARNERMELYAEVGGMPSGTTYAVELAVIRAEGGDLEKILDGTIAGERPVTLSFKGSHRGGIQPIRRELSLKALSPGMHVLELVVTGPDGVAMVRRRPFEVVK